MKRSLLLSALLLGSTTLAIAQEKKIEITPLIGYNIAEGNIGIKDDGYAVYGLELQFNTPSSKISPEFSVLYSNGVDYDNSTTSTKIIRMAFNGVYSYDSMGFVTPFIKAGFGYEKVSAETNNNFGTAFVDAGAGLKIPFSDSIALKLEAIYMLKDISGRRDSNLVTLMGINFAFGDYEQKAAPVAQKEPEPVMEKKPEPIVEPEPVKEVKAEAVAVAPVVIDSDDDNDGVKNSKDKCPTTEAGKTVNSEGCFIDSDDDNDGVLNASDKCKTTPVGREVDAIGCLTDEDNDGVLNTQDKCPGTLEGRKVNNHGCFEDEDDDSDGVLNSFDECPKTPLNREVDAGGCLVDEDNDGVLNIMDICPNTPAGDAVNSDGCPATMNLNIQFEHNSFNVDAASEVRIQKYADFLSKFSAYSAKIVGYTDSRGSAQYNQVLSEKRANAVKNMLIEKGAPASRVSSVGMGEVNPIADNMLRAGRAQNRRIEAELTKK